MVLTLLTLIVGCVMLLLAAAFGAFAYLLRHPPVIHVDLGDVRVDVTGTFDATQMIPSILKIQTIPASAADQPQFQEPIPLDILAYIDQESDEWARVARRTRARALFAETANWEHVLSTLQREDGVEPAKTE